MASHAWYVFHYRSRGTGSDSERRDMNAHVPPPRVWEWLKKPSSARAYTASHPSDAADWLMGQVKEHASQLPGPVLARLEESGFDTSHIVRDLTCEHTYVFAAWLSDGSFLEYAAVPNDTRERELHP